MRKIFQKKAKELHELYPNVYKDSNHKPELAIALCPFEALCGFRSINEIKDYLNNIPELLAIVGEINVRRLSRATDSMISNALQQCFYSLMTCNSTEVTQHLRSLINRLHDAGNNFYIFIECPINHEIYNKRKFSI